MSACVSCKQFEFLEFVFKSVYVELHYDEISLTCTAGYVCLCGVCSPVVVPGLSVRLSWYPMLWLRCVCVVVVSAYMGGTRGSGVLASAYDVLEISVARGVGGVCDMCMCLARGGIGGEWVTGLGLGFTNSGGTWGEWDMCLCFGCGGVGGVGVEYVGGLGQCLGE